MSELYLRNGRFTPEFDRKKMLARRHIFCRLLAVLFVSASLAAAAQDVDVSMRVEVSHSGHVHKAEGSSANVVVWLTPVEKTTPPLQPRRVEEYTLTQKDKQFIPHLLVVPTGSNVSFPNLDPFFHNVFSLFNGKRFDLGLYEAHTKRSVKFDREGISYIFCNIHPDMGAVVISLGTPYYAISTGDGMVALHHVPPGTYHLNVWAENVANDMLDRQSRSVVVGVQDQQLGTIHLESTGDVMRHHTNKFGEKYFPQNTKSY